MSATYRFPDAIVSTDWLAEHLEDPQVRVFECTTYLLYRPEGDDAPYDVGSGRPDFDTGHIPGALSVPLDRLQAILAELPVDQEIVAYCRGPYCILAVQAVEVLRKKGFNAVRLEESVHDWRAMGLPVTVGDEVAPPR